MTLQTDERIHILNSCVCSICDSGLIDPWDPTNSKNLIRCSRNRSHSGYKRVDEIANRLSRMGASQDELTRYFVNEELRKGRKIMQETIERNGTTALAQYQGTTALTNDQAKLVIRTIWPDAPDVEVVKAAMVCAQYGFNPLMKHLYLIPYQKRENGRVVGTTWARVLGIGATRLIAARKGGVTYTDGPRWMKDDEQTEIFGEVDGANIVVMCKVKAMADGREAPGYGRYPKGEKPKGMDKGNTPVNMAMIRAERNAIDRLFPGEMPADMGVIDEQYAPVVGEAIDTENAADYQYEDETVSQLESPSDDEAERTLLRKQLVSILTSTDQLAMTEAEAMQWLGGHGTGNMSVQDLKAALARADQEKVARMFDNGDKTKQETLI